MRPSLRTIVLWKERRRGRLAWDGRRRRCIYHGWKYGVEGNVLRRRAKPPTSRLKDVVKLKAYPTQEVNGLVFTYMGPKARMPLLPNYEWLTDSSRPRAQSKYVNENNWLQSVEGDCDSSHVEFLHRRAGDRNTLPETLDLAPGSGISSGMRSRQAPGTSRPRRFGTWGKA